MSYPNQINSYGMNDIVRRITRMSARSRWGEEQNISGIVYPFSYANSVINLPSSPRKTSENFVSLPSFGNIFLDEDGLPYINL